MTTLLQSLRHKMANQIPRDECFLEELIECLVLATYEANPDDLDGLTICQAVRREFAEQMGADSADTLAFMANARNLDDIVDYADVEFAEDIMDEALRRVEAL